MLLKDFYTITNIQSEADSYTIQLELNADHEVYKGHFPGQPVLPGVCSMQIVKECVEKIKEKELRYSQIQTCKFLSVIDPKADNQVELAIILADGENGSISLQADIIQKQQPVTKLKATLKAA